jgi:hypothetical protein
MEEQFGNWESIQERHQGGKQCHFQPGPPPRNRARQWSQCNPEYPRRSPFCYISLLSSLLVRYLVIDRVVEVTVQRSKY